MTLDGALVYLLWIAPQVVQAATVILMFRRKLARDFPWFLAYTAVAMTHSVVLLSLYNPRWYTRFYTFLYFSGMVLCQLLRFGVVYEIFTQFMRDYPVLNGLAGKLYRWVCAALLLASVAVIASSSGKMDDYVTVWVDVVDRMVSIIQCGLLVFLLAMSRFLGFSWRNRAFGIALGMGLFSSVELAVAAVRSHVGVYQIEMLLGAITMATYNVCVLIWLFYLWLPEEKAAYVREPVPSNVLDGWDAALKRVLNR